MGNVPVRVEGKVTLANGETVEFMLTPGDNSWHQWGNSRSVLYSTMPLVEALQDAAREHLGEGE